jgi:pimeloyl-ACP methyl ester carboxylesterase
METVLDVGGVPTWYAEHGAGKPLVYLHGGFSDAGELDAVLPRYAEHFRVLTPDRRGHGRTADVDGPFDYQVLAEDIVAFLEAVVGGPADLVGYSDGATTALLVALARPDLVDRMVLISGQFHHSGLLPDMFGDDAAAAAAELAGSRLAERYAQVSPDGGDHFVVVAEKVIRMAMTQPTLEHERLSAVRARTLVVSGDDDVVALEHTVALYRGIPGSELAVVPGTSHVLIMEKPERVADIVMDFLLSEPVATIAPIRRRGSA